jgi:Protein ChrB, N-terminal
MPEKLRWALLAYRLPREPSTPRIAVWRKLRRLGVAQLGDGLVALPLDERTREALDWLADEIGEAGGDASVWLAQPGTQAQERALAEAMTAAVVAEYAALIADATSAAAAPPASRRRTLARLRRELQRIRRRDYFPPPERERAEAALAQLGATLAEATV